MAPTLGNGKICYIEMPASDIERSAEFYEKVFGWRIRRRGDGSIAFDDGVGEVSGTWLTGRPAAAPGLLIYTRSTASPRRINAVVAHGGDRAAHRRGTRRKSPLVFSTPQET